MESNKFYTGTSKKFDQKIHDENDRRGKEAVIQFLTNQGLRAWENPDRYGIDLFVEGTSRKGITFNRLPIEVERRPRWERGNFPNKNYNIPHRKKKFFKSKCLYAVVNRDCNKVMFCSSRHIIESALVEIPNRFCLKGEYFYKVPIRRFKTYDIEWR